MAAEGVGATAKATPAHPLLWLGELIVAMLLVLSVLALPKFTDAVGLASQLSAVEDFGQYITIATPGLAKFGPGIFLVLTAGIAFSVSASRRTRTTAAKGMLTFLCAVPGVSVALSGVWDTVLVAIPGAIIGLVITRGRNDPFEANVFDLLAWVAAVSGVYAVAVQFAQAAGG